MAARPANPALAYDILRVTADLIEEKGPDALTMREVAERLGYSATTIYLYYKNKGELLEAAIDREFERFADSQALAGRNASSGLEALRARSREYVIWGIEHPNVYRAMFERKQHLSPERRQLRRRALAAFADTVKSLMEDGELRHTDDIQELVNIAWATNHGLVSLIISGRMFGHVGEDLSLDQAKAHAAKMVGESFDHVLAAWATNR
jgi:AcrR family transcriptional regulator